MRRQVSFLSLLFCPFSMIMNPLLYRFYISVQELLDGEDIAHCPSCTLKIRVIYDDAVLDKFMPTTASNEEANQAIVSAEEFEKAAVVTEA